MYVAALLEKQHKVRIIDAPAEGYKNLELIDPRKYRFGLSNKQIEAEIKQFSPDVVVITAPFLGWWKSVFEVATAAKEVDKNIVTVLIGMDPSVRPIDCLNEPNIDFVVIGEPEQGVLELVNALGNAKSDEQIKNVKGIAFMRKRNHNYISKTANRKFRRTAFSRQTPVAHGQLLCSCKRKPSSRRNFQAVGSNDYKQRVPSELHFLFNPHCSRQKLATPKPTKCS